MATNHDAVAALPASGAANKALLRNAITTRMPYVLADADTPTDLVAVDPASGAAIIDIVYLGRLFHYDPTDALTPNDGVTCLVSFEGRRYKLSDGADVFCYAVLDNTHSAPPASPSLGDAYLVAAAATGAWAGKSDQIAVRTARGWEFINFGIGRFIYVESVESYYHRNSGGVWVVGLGSNSYEPASVPITAVIGTKASFVMKVENRTTNTPPASPTAPTAYIIGPSPTGAWAGQSNNLAVCLVAGTFTIIAPVAGDEVYDKAAGGNYRFNGTAWVASVGAWALRDSAFNSGASAAAIITTASGYSYSNTVAPTTSFSRAVDDQTLTFAAPRAGAKIRFHYRARMLNGASSTSVALMRDNEAAALDWVEYTDNALNTVFEIAANDANPHTYQVVIFFSANASQPSTPARRLFQYEVTP